MTSLQAQDIASPLHMWANLLEKDLLAIEDNFNVEYDILKPTLC